MAEVQFKPLKDVGTLPITDTSELRFYVDEYKGYTYASIRTFVKREDYSGPTKAGLTLNPGLLKDLIETLEKLPPEPAATEDKELARFPKKAGLELVVRITLYHDSTGVDIREWVDDGTYTGWSKKGVRLQYPAIAQALGFLREMRTFLEKQPKKPPAEKKKSAAPEDE